MAKNNQAGADPAAKPVPAADSTNQGKTLPAAGDPPVTEEPPKTDPPKNEPPKDEVRKVLLLVDTAFGRCAQVVELLVHEAEALVKGGHADDNPAAIAAHED